MIKTYDVTSVENLQDLAASLAELLQAGDVIALEGDLGAGKTTFTQGLARGLGVKGVVNSPTFTIIKEYTGRLPLYHMDVYRVGEDCMDMGLDEYFFGEGVCVVEWASLISPILPPEHLSIWIQRGENDQERTIFLEAVGQRYIQLCEEFDQHARFGD